MLLCWVTSMLSRRWGKPTQAGVRGLAGSPELGHCCSSRPQTKKVPVTCTGHWVNKQMAVLVFGTWFLQSSQKASPEDLSRFFATVSAASFAFRQSTRDQGEASLVTCQIFKPYTYLISMHICHVFEFWNPDSVFIWKASHNKNPQVSAFTGKKSIEKWVVFWSDKGTLGEWEQWTNDAASPTWQMFHNHLSSCN